MLIILENEILFTKEEITNQEKGNNNFKAENCKRPPHGVTVFKTMRPNSYMFIVFSGICIPR
jgi:hypothetical protein